MHNKKGVKCPGCGSIMAHRVVMGEHFFICTVEGCNWASPCRNTEEDAYLVAMKRSAAIKPMMLNEYQHLAQRTSSNAPGVFDTLAARKIDNGILGIAGEGGECADIWKKYLHQGHPLDREKLIKEAGDVLWYIAELAAGLGVTLEEIATRNIEKLSARYPDGHFDAERSIHREGTED